MKPSLLPLAAQLGAITIALGVLIGLAVATNDHTRAIRRALEAAPSGSCSCPK